MKTALVASILFVALQAPASAAENASPPAKVVAKPEAFPTLVNPQCSHCRDEAKRRAGELKADEPVVAWIRGKYDGGAIPLRFFLVPYRVISDTYGVFVFDADAGYARGFEPSLDFTFHGWRNGVMVMKHRDGTLYSCLSGLAFDGPRKGDVLKPIPTLETTWGHFSGAYPGGVAYHMFEKYRPVELPQGGNADSLATRGPADARLPALDQVIGITVGGTSRAYPIAALEKAGGLIADRIGDERVQVLWLREEGAGAAYSRAVEDSSPPQEATLSVDRARPAAPFIDRETGSRWGIEGRALEGPQKGKTLRWLPSLRCRWFAWAADYPHTGVYSASGTSAP